MNAVATALSRRVLSFGTAPRQSKAATDPFDRPFRMLGNQWLGIARGLFQRRQIFAAADVSKGDADVPQKTAALDALDRRVAKQIAKLGFAQLQIIAQRKICCRPMRRECAFTRHLGETIPRTCVQTIVAAENPIADEWAQRGRNRAF